jgi:hypothetical protein
MQIGQLSLQLDMIMGVAADVARPAGSGANAVKRVLHSPHNGRMLAHAEIVVRAPDGDRLRPVVPGEALGVGILALGPQDVDEHAVTAFTVKAIDRGFEDAVVIHGYSWTLLTGGL